MVFSLFASYLDGKSLAKPPKPRERKSLVPESALLAQKNVFGNIAKDIL
jgi:hypothetical protein